MNGREKKAKAAKDPIQNPQYIYQYKIQNIVPNTFSNTESIAQEESLHNQLKKINHYPSTVEGGGEGLLISSPHYRSSANTTLVHFKLLKMIVCAFLKDAGCFRPPQKKKAVFQRPVCVFLKVKLLPKV